MTVYKRSKSILPRPERLAAATTTDSTQLELARYAPVSVLAATRCSLNKFPKCYGEKQCVVVSSSPLKYDQNGHSIHHSSTRLGRKRTSPCHFCLFHFLPGIPFIHTQPDHETRSHRTILVASLHISLLQQRKPFCYRYNHCYL